MQVTDGIRRHHNSMAVGKTFRRKKGGEKREGEKKNKKKIKRDGIEKERSPRGRKGCREKLYQFKVVQEIRVRLLIVVHTTSGELTRDFDGGNEV